MATETLDPMATFEELLPKLNRTQKARALRRIADELDEGWAGISHTPGVCGGSACVGRTRIMVWLLEAFRRDGANVEELLEHYPTLRTDEIERAWAYAAAHPEEVDHDIQRNERD